MIKIIKDGSLKKLNKTKRFTCSKCGCIFEADDSSYTINSWRNEKIYITAICPFCGKSVSRDYEDYEA